MGIKMANNTQEEAGIRPRDPPPSFTSTLGTFWTWVDYKPDGSPGFVPRRIWASRVEAIEACEKAWGKKLEWQMNLVDKDGSVFAEPSGEIELDVYPVRLMTTYRFAGGPLPVKEEGWR